MPDQVFDSFTENVPVRPLPAAEVRRRGDRRRTGRYAAIGVAGLAAIAVTAVAVPVAVGGHASDNPSLPIATAPSTQPTSTTTMPSDLDLGAGMGDGSTEPRMISGAELADLSLDLCGRRVWSGSEASAVRSVELAEAEGGHQRTLAVYPGVQRAEHALATIAGAARACHGVQAGPPKYEVFTSPENNNGLGTTNFVMAYRDATGLTGEGEVVSVLQDANYLLIDAATTMGVGDPQVRRQALGKLRQRDASVLQAITPDFEG